MSAEQREQLDLVQNRTRGHLAKRDNDLALEARIQSYELAYRMQTEATDAFDVNRETPETREMYGPGNFARQCLIARRLAERGVRFIQLYHGAGQPGTATTTSRSPTGTSPKNLTRRSARCSPT